MNTIDFFRTPMGKKYYEHDLPLLIESNKVLATAIERQNKLKEKELRLHQKNRDTAKPTISR